MKIVIVLGPFQPLPPVGMGAVEKVWFGLAQGFAKAGHDVLLVGKAGASVSPTVPPGVRVLRMRGFESTKSLLLNLAKDLLYAITVGWRLESGDVIVTNSFWAPVTLTLPLGVPKKVIVHVARFPKGQMSLYRRASVLQAISSPVAKEIARQSPSMLGKVKTLPYPVDLDVYKPPVNGRPSGSDKTILYAGRVHPEKGLDILVRAFRLVHARVPQTRLKIVGPTSLAQGGGGGAWLDALMALARDLPVEFAGPIAEPWNLALEMQQSQCFCYPSIAEKGEAFGLSVLEAMATGLPVAVSSLACFGDFLTDGRDGLVFDHRAEMPEERLAEALIRILCEPGLADRLGANAAERSREFGYEALTGRYLSLLQEVAGC